ncbi:MAG: LUD domain-containing protein [Halanaeroarchaeum sp.]
MGTETVSRFESSLGSIDVPLTRTDRDGFASALNEIVTEPAVGVPLDGVDGVSLAETVVQTPPTPRLLQEAETGVTPVRKGIARYGSLAVESDEQGSELVSLYPPTHVAVLRERDVLQDVDASLGYLEERFGEGGSTVFATGVSATGDMGALIEGVHGPRDVHVLLVTER